MSENLSFFFLSFFTSFVEIRDSPPVSNEVIHTIGNGDGRKIGLLCI